MVDCVIPVRPANAGIRAVRAILVRPSDVGVRADHAIPARPAHIGINAVRVGTEHNLNSVVGDFCVDDMTRFLVINFGCSVVISQCQGPVLQRKCLDPPSIDSTE